MFPGAPAALVTRAAFLLFRGDNAVTNSLAGSGATKPTLKVMQVVAVMLIAAMLAGCSREKIDWKSAEAADTVEAYDHFLQRHPDGELSTQARARVAQLNEARDWKKASAADTADAYRQFLAQHENGKWAGEARIRVENFALDGTASGPLRPSTTADGASTASASAAAEPQPGAFGPRKNAGDSRSPAPPTMPASSPATTAPAPQPAPAHVATTSALAKSSATPTSPAPKPVAAPAATGPSVTPKQPSADSASEFGIQLGAFRSQQAALSDWKRIQGRFDSDLHGLFAQAVPIQQASGQLFRLQAPVGKEARARAICASLARQSQPCLVVLPRAH
jgi:hypothetical protein